MALLLPLCVTWVTAAGMKLFFTQMENWAELGPVENLGKSRNQANRIGKKNYSNVMERV